MTYYALNNTEGNRLYAVLPEEATAKISMVDDDIHLNKIVRVVLTKNGNVEMYDENDHNFLVVECQDYDDACHWALRNFGWVCQFETEN